MIDCTFYYCRDGQADEYGPCVSVDMAVVPRIGERVAMFERQAPRYGDPLKRVEVWGVVAMVEWRPHVDLANQQPWPVKECRVLVTRTPDWTPLGFGLPTDAPVSAPCPPTENPE